MTVFPRVWAFRGLPLALAALIAGASATWAQQAPPVDPLEAAAMSVAPGRDAASRHDDRAHPKGDAQRSLQAARAAGAPRRQDRPARRTASPTASTSSSSAKAKTRSGRWSASSARRSTRHYGGTAGPLHNQIPQPDRTVDNTTIWSPDFSRRTTRTLLFSTHPGAVSMRNFYIEISSNRYAVNGARHRLGAGAVQRGQLRRQLLRQHRLRRAPGCSCAIR